ncbi:hypothetical protein GCK32_020265, partial [Trichostrongylus colubriformis]
TPFIPAYANFETVANSSKPGFLEVPLDHLNEYLWISIYKTGSIAIESVKLLYTQCDATSIDGALIMRSYSFSKPRQIPVACGTLPMQAVVTAVCHPQTGWTLQVANPCCDKGFHYVDGQCVPDSCNHTFCGRGSCAEKDGVAMCQCDSGELNQYKGQCVPFLLLKQQCLESPSAAEGIWPV